MSLARVTRPSRSSRWRPSLCRPPDTDRLNDLAGLGVLSDIEAQPDELKDFGLQPPRSIFEAQVHGRQQPFTLQIGDHNPSTTGVYVRLGATGKVVLVGAFVRWDFEQAFRSFALVSEQ